MEILAIIPARGGSKSVPRKNIKKIGGIPLVGHSILQAQKSKFIKRVIVSTDDQEIGDISKNFGAEVMIRPSEISGDLASSESALIHTIETLKEKEEYEPFLIVFLQCTSPLTLVEDIDGTIRELLDKDADSAFSATEFHYFLWNYDNYGSVIGINHDKNYRQRRQDRKPQFIETGAVYVMKTKGFLKYKHRFFGKTVMYNTPLERSFEIDEPVDFIILETLMALQKENSRRKELPTLIEAIFFDFDGVFTDNKVYLDENGKEIIMFDRGDGMAISQLKKSNIKMYILSSEINDVCQQRAKKLKIKAYNGLENKLEKLIEISELEGINLANCLFVGNDINDIDCMKKVGCPIVVNDAYEEVKTHAKIILRNRGGYSAIRELSDIIINRSK